MKKSTIALTIATSMILTPVTIHAEPIKPMTVSELVEKYWGFQDKLIQWEDDYMKSHFKNGEYPIMNFQELTDWLCEKESKYIKSHFENNKYPFEKYSRQIKESYKEKIDESFNDITLIFKQEIKRQKEEDQKIFQDYTKMNKQDLQEYINYLLKDYNKVSERVNGYE